MTSDELLPLPEVIPETPLSVMHQYTADQMRAYALANLQSAKPADALGSLPVVAGVAKFLREGGMPDTADMLEDEIAKRDAEIERLKYQLGGGELAAQELERQVDYLRAKLAGVDGLVNVLRAIIDNGPFTTGQKALLNAGSAALATYEAAQGKKEITG